jgi:hypothetical protein
MAIPAALQVFGGGDSNGIYNELFGDLLNRGKISRSYI